MQLLTLTRTDYCKLKVKRAEEKVWDMKMKG